jgi:SAM-dependent methyltransferase
MKIGARPEGVIERLAFMLDLTPTPIADTHVAFTAARAIMTGTSLGIFDAIADGADTPAAIAAACHTDERATHSLLGCLVALGYLRLVRGRYANARRVKKWLLARSPHSLRDKVLFQTIEWTLVSGLEDFVRTGKAVDLHAALEPRGWSLYQDAMRALAASSAPVIARRIRLPRHAERMLDVGGSHGLYSVALCRRYPRLRSEILELPAAAERSSLHVSRHGLGDRVRLRIGDALRDDLGEDIYDLVLVNNLVHHFSDAENAALAKRVARALRPGGLFVIGDIAKTAAGRRGAFDRTLDLYFALTSNAGTWSIATMRAWQKGAGLVPRRAIRPLEMPAYVLSTASKP